MTVHRYVHVTADVSGSQKRAHWVPLELELYMVVSFLTRCLDVNLGLPQEQNYLSSSSPSFSFLTLTASNVIQVGFKLPM